MPGHVTHADKGDGTPVCGESGFEKLVPIDEFKEIRHRAGAGCSRCTLSLGLRRKKAHEYTADEVRDRVKIEKAPRRKYSFGAFSDKSLNRILIDGVPCGFLALEMGWGKPWHLETIDGVFVCKCFARDKPGCLPDALERFDAGELPTEAMLEQRKADRLRQERERAEHAERLKVQRLQEEHQAAQARQRAQETARRTLELLERLALQLTPAELELMGFACSAIRVKYNLNDRSET